jgi:hypothetical protein
MERQRRRSNPFSAWGDVASVLFGNGAIVVAPVLFRHGATKLSRHPLSALITKSDSYDAVKLVAFLSCGALRSAGKRRHFSVGSRVQDQSFGCLLYSPCLYSDPPLSRRMGVVCCLVWMQSILERRLVERNNW